MKRGLGNIQEDILAPQRDTTLLKRFFPYVKKNARMVTLSILLMVLLSATEMVVPFVTRQAIDRYILPGMALTEQLDEMVAIEAAKRNPEVRAMDVSQAVDVPEAVEAPGAKAASKGIDASETKALPKVDDGPEAIDLEAMSEKREAFLFMSLMAGGVLLLLALIRFLINFVQILVMEYAGQRMMHDLRMEIFSHIQQLPLSYFSKNSVGRVSTRVTNDVQNMQEMFTSIITFVLKDALMMIGILLILFGMDFRLAGALFLVLPLVALSTWLFSRLSREVYRFLRVNVAEINAMFSESVNGMKVIQLFNRQKEMIADFYDLNHENFLAGMRQIRIQGLFMPMVDLFSAVTLAVILYYGGGRVFSEHLSLGTLVAFISYTKMLFRPVRDLSEKHNILQNALASGERIVQILDTKRDEKGGHESLERLEEIAFDNVAFQYEPGEENQVIREVSFSVKRGEALAILGPTGSGKTSLMNLIVRFYPHDKGEIRINNKKIEAYSIQGIRSKVAIVTQDPYLFSGTIRENIVPRGVTLNDERLHEILKISYADTIVSRLSDGLDTVITQGGASLSSGERQLISIARAFAHEPDLIIFDEATSYVDTESEEKIRIATAKLKQNRTSITIAHRLRSAVTADKIIVLKEGIVWERGNHESLMAKKGFYYALHQAEAR